MVDVKNAAVWSKETFGGAQLGDKRRTSRLVKVAGDLAQATGVSLAASCQGDRAAQEAAYRFARSPFVEPQAIAEAGFAATAKDAATYATLLAIEDSTTLSYRHGVVDELGDLGGKEDATARGMWVHSVLLVDPESALTVGLVEQERWIRDPEARGQKHQRRERDYEDKESFKWQQASENLRHRLGPELMKRVVSECDREADVYLYLADKVEHGERFNIRAQWDRNVLDGDEAKAHLFEVLDRAPECGKAQVEVPQRGGRPARSAELVLRKARVRLVRPASLEAKYPAHVGVNVVLAREEHPPVGREPLEWVLLTSEPINTPAEVERVLRWYRLRWRIEVFHKVWKTGAGVERQRMQSADNLERIAVVLEFVAVRLMQLREHFEHHTHVPCDQVLDPDEWKLLWVSVEKSRPPTRCPSGDWAFHALARLAGWTDTKRTGQVGWDTLWRGWATLQERLAGFLAARQLGGAKK